MEFCNKEEARCNKLELAFAKVGAMLPYTLEAQLILSGLENDAIHRRRQGWGENLYFFLKGAEACGAITHEQLIKALSLFDEFNHENFRKYENVG